MLLTDSEGKARWPRVQPIVTPHQPGAERRDQRAAERRDQRAAERVDRRAAERVDRRAYRLAGLSLLLVLSGCSDVPDQINPVSWWHHLEGGAIAQGRPPPPNANAPFPKIANQPTRPVGMPDWEWKQLSGALAAQRAQAQTYAAQNPIPTLPPAAGQPAAAPPRPSPEPAAPPATPPADTGQSAATAAEIARLAAAQGPAGSQTPAPSAAAVATATANAGNTSTSALTFQGPSARPPSSAGPQSEPIRDATTTPGSPKPGGASAGTNISYFDPSNGLSIPGALSPVAQPDEAHPPPVPESVPRPPPVPGFAISTIPSTYVAPVPLPEPAPYVPPAPLPAARPVPIRFAPHSAVLTPPMQKALLTLAQARGAAHIEVTGFGDAPGPSIGAQAAAMPLALERTRAMVVQLMADGVAVTGINAGARALGSGGLARLAD
jgi:outer membrane protein OmpA-like peptidoglycan-associated protein